jgi:hypothetical protein
MFAKTIIDSDAFLDMPMSARLLYYDLCMRGDDDGFVNSPKKIMRIVGASQDDLNLLVLKRFIIPFESGVVVIKHWFIHNYIRKDMYHETKYTEEKSMLRLNEKGAYVLDNTFEPSLQPCNEPVTNLYTQRREDKKREEKDIYTSVSDGEYDNKNKLFEAKTNDEKYDYEFYRNTFNGICCSLPSVRFITDKRKKLVREFEKLYGRETFEELCRKAEASSFLSGRKNPGGWRADFDFLLRKDKIPAILEGQYDDFEQMKIQTDRWN